MPNPLRLGIFSELQQVRDRQRGRQESADQKAVALGERVRQRAAQETAGTRQAALDQRANEEYEYKKSQRPLEEAMRRAQVAGVQAKSRPMPKPKQLPSNVIEKMVGVDNMRSSAEGVQHSLEEAVASHTNATGTVLGFKTPTRIKNLFGMGGEQGQRTRNIIGSLKGQIAKERAGSAMSPAELDLLESYIPTDNDDEAVAISKAKDFIKSLDQIKTNRAKVYAKYGYGDEQSEPEQDDEQLPFSSYDR